MIPLPPHRDPFDGYEPGSLHVFVPGLMGAGVLLSIGLMAADLVHRLRGDRAARREIDLVAWFVARDVVRSVHRDAELDRTVGLRSRRAYVLNAVVFLGLGIYGLIGSTWNYANPVDEGWVEDIAWVWAVSMLAVVGLLGIGAVLAFIAWRYPDVPPWARRFLARTPIGVAPAVTPAPRHRPRGGATGTPRSGPAPSASPPGTRRPGAAPPR